MARRVWKVKTRAPRPGKRQHTYTLRAEATIDGRRCERTLTTPTTNAAEAKRLAYEWELDLNSQDLPDVLAAVVDKRLVALEAEGKAKGTLDRYRATREAILDVGGMEGDKPTLAALLSLRDRMVATDRWAARTINGYLRDAGCAWRWCHARELVTDPWPRVSPLKTKAPDKRPYTHPEVAAILAWLKTHKPRWYPLVVLIAETGRRVSEVCQLRGRDFTLGEKPVLHVRLKGGKEYAVPLLPSTGAAIPQRGPEDWVFRARKKEGGFGPVLPSTVRNVMRKAAIGTGIKDHQRVDTHSLRRYACGALDRAGVPMSVGMRITGHETPTMYMHYMRLWVGDDLRSAVEQLAGARAAAVPPQPAPEIAGAPDVTHGQSRTRTGDFLLVSGRSGGLQVETPAGQQQPDPAGATPAVVEGLAQNRSSVVRGHLEVLADFAAAHPRAMIQLLEDPELQQLLHQAILANVNSAELLRTLTA